MQRALTAMDRAIGRTIFGTSPHQYAKSRPGYPPEVYEILKSTCGAGPGTDAFEIGPGTGQATAHLLALGCSVTAIEPDARLAAYLADSLAAQEAHRLTVSQAAFEDAGLPTAAFDLGVAATSFHWLDTTAALTKGRRLLRAGGWWSMWWNVYGDPDCPDAFQQRTHALFEPLGRTLSSGDRPRLPYALDREQRLAALADAGFQETGVEIIRWTTTFTTEEMVALIATFSNVASRPDAERHTFLDHIRRISDAEFGGTIRRSFVTAIYTARSPRRMLRPA